MKDIIQTRLERYAVTTEVEQEYAIKEITQEFILYALYHAGFFEVAAFQGGTALRVVHGLRRFSEDLDFALHEADQDFRLDGFLERARVFLSSFGYSLEVIGKEKIERAAQSRFLKQNSLGKIFELRHQRDSRRSIKIKVEVDTHPALGATTQTHVLDFPLDFPLIVFDLPSLFASKSHALLCRPYVKGRDWYDFAWYASQSVPINATLLQNALKQMGPWKGKDIEVNRSWYLKQMGKKIAEIPWEEIKRDVAPLLLASDREQLKLWSEAYFMQKLEKLVSRNGG